MRGIGEKGMVPGEAPIQIRLKGPGMILDLTFSILGKNVPSLLSTKDIRESGLDISLQGNYLHVSDHRHQLHL